jgi:hypothetical protein
VLAEPSYLNHYWNGLPQESDTLFFDNPTSNTFSLMTIDSVACVKNESVNVNIVAPYSPNLSEEYELFCNDTLTLDISSNQLNTAFWSDGTTTFVNSFHEGNLNNGPNSFAVLCTDINNCVSASEFIINYCTLQTDELSNSNAICILPNPTQGVSILKLEDFHQVSIEVIDLFGKIIFKEEEIETKEYVLPSDAFSKGTYFIRVFNDTNSEILQFVKY